MKKITMIFAVAFAAGFLTTTTISAIQPTQMTGVMLSINKEITLENEVKLEKWMYTPQVFSTATVENGLSLSSWMIQTNEWMQSSNQIAVEPEIEVEDWMLRIDERDNSIALEEWMINISG